MIDWRKYPDEKPLETEDDGILVVVNAPSCKPCFMLCGYDKRENYFYNYEDWTGQSNKIPLLSDCIVCWVYTCEIPLPEEYL